MAESSSSRRCSARIADTKSTTKYLQDHSFSTESDSAEENIDNNLKIQKTSTAKRQSSRLVKVKEEPRYSQQKDTSSSCKSSEDSSEEDESEENLVADSKTPSRRKSSRLVKKTSRYSEKDKSSFSCQSSEDYSDSSDDENEENRPKKHCLETGLLPSFSSPGSYAFASSAVDPYNHESYLLASTRLKFKTIPSRQDIGVTNDSRKGRAKKPRKGTRGLGGRKVDNLPERDTRTNFSVTKATATALELCPVVVQNLKHDQEIRAHLENSIIPDFPRWLSFMWEGFNVILHGFGSKLPVIDAFREKFADSFILFEINGLHPKLNSRKILMDFVGTLKTKIKVKGTTVDVTSEGVYNQLPRTHRPVFMIVQSFDTLAAGNPNILTVICSLAQIPWVHLLATTDSVNASVGITQSQSVQLNFCWIPCSTFQPYIEEFQWTPSVFGESNGSKTAENTLQYVLKSLTGNARKAFSILVTLQVSKLQGFGSRSKNRKGNEFEGVEFSELAQKCKDNFVAHNDTVLRTLLVEFIDHKLVTNHQGKKKGGGNFLTVDLDIEVLQKIIKDGI